MMQAASKLIFTSAFFNNNQFILLLAKFVQKCIN